MQNMLCIMGGYTSRNKREFPSLLINTDIKKSSFRISIITVTTSIATCLSTDYNRN